VIGNVKVTGNDKIYLLQNVRYAKITNCESVDNPEKNPKIQVFFLGFL